MVDFEDYDGRPLAPGENLGSAPGRGMLPNPQSGGTVSIATLAAEMSTLQASSRRIALNGETVNEQLDKLLDKYDAMLALMQRLVERTEESTQAQRKTHKAMGLIINRSGILQEATQAISDTIKDKTVQIRADAESDHAD